MTFQNAKKLILALLVVGVAVGAYLQFGDQLSLDYLATQEASLRTYQEQHPLLTYVLAFVLYVTVTGLSIPGATVLTLLYAWFFGFVRGAILVSFASTAGATVAFLISRYLFRSAIQEKFGERLKQLNDSLEKEGPFYLFTMRLIPAIPFFVLNVVMGLTPLKTTTFWWVSQLGMLPGTLVYVYAGASVPTLLKLAEQGTSGILTSNLIAAFFLLGLFPLVARYVLSKFRSPEPKAQADV